MSEIKITEWCGDIVFMQRARRLMAGGLTMEECELNEDTGFFRFLRLWQAFTQTASSHMQSKTYLTNVKCFCRTALEAIEAPCQ